MLEIRRSDRICIAGLPRTGKTIFTRYLATLASPNILIVDPLSQYEMFPEECRYVPRQETAIELEAIAKQLHARSNVTLIIEESEQYLAQGKALLPYTSALIRMGRNWGIGIWATTRRIQDLNKRFFDLAQHVFFFRCGFKSREYISDMIGSEYMYPAASPKYNHTGHTITTLPPFHCLHFNLETEIAQIITLKLKARGAAMGQIEEVGKQSKAGASTAKDKIEEKEPKLDNKQLAEAEEKTIA